MEEIPAKLVEKLCKGATRALARAISLIEDAAVEAEEILRLVYPHTGSAYVIGVTGSPGAGKSTLVDFLAKHLSAQGKKVGILAVDPTSPYTGGALLGDRIRMHHAAEIENVFIRSMATRGALGGLAPKTAEAIFALDAAGYDVIIVETVGVGQAEVEIVRHADSVVVVLVPGMGDGVQALKAGIIEIADVFAINKADYEGVERLHRELISVLSLGAKSERKPKIVRTIASKDEGVSELLAELEAHKQWAEDSGQRARRNALFLQRTFERELSNILSGRVLSFAEQQGLLASGLKQILAREKDPKSVAKSLIDKFFKEPAAESSQKGTTQKTSK